MHLGPFYGRKIQARELLSFTHKHGWLEHGQFIDEISIETSMST